MLGQVAAATAAAIVQRLYQAFVTIVIIVCNIITSSGGISIERHAGHSRGHNSLLRLSSLVVEQVRARGR